MDEHPVMPDRPEDRDVSRRTNYLSMVAFGLGALAVIVGLSGCFCPFTWAATPWGFLVPPIAGLLAVICGFIARGQYEIGTPTAGMRLAVWGMYLGAAAVVLGVALWAGSYMGWIPELQTPVTTEPLEAEPQ